MAVSEPSSTIGTERRGMRTLQDKVALRVYQRCFAAGKTTPQHIDNMFSVVRKGTYAGIGKLLPAAPLMRCCLMSTHGERGIEQQNALLCPPTQTAGRWHLLAQISLYLLEDVNKRWRRRYPFLYRKAQTFCLSRLMIRVLTYYHDLHLVERTQVEGIEYLASWWITGCGGILLTHEVYQIGEVRLREFLAHMLFPRFFYLYIHSRIVLL